MFSKWKKQTFSFSACSMFFPARLLAGQNLLGSRAGEDNATGRKGKHLLFPLEKT